jgi:hypothetical protein
MCHRACVREPACTLFCTFVCTSVCDSISLCPSRCELARPETKRFSCSLMFAFYMKISPNALHLTGKIRWERDLFWVVHSNAKLYV